MMERPNKTKPEGYMWPLGVPGMAPDVRIEYRTTEAGLYLKYSRTALGKPPTARYVSKASTRRETYCRKRM